MNKELVFQTTRSNNSPDEYRDMSGFNVDDELNRLLLALSIEKQKDLSSNIKFIFEAIKNIDEHLNRHGVLPERWRKAKTKEKLKDHEDNSFEKYMKNV